jgi:hypothetical protein
VRTSSLALLQKKLIGLGKQLVYQNRRKRQEVMVVVRILSALSICIAVTFHEFIAGRIWIR